MIWTFGTEDAVWMVQSSRCSIIGGRLLSNKLFKKFVLRQFFEKLII